MTSEPDQAGVPQVCCPREKSPHRVPRISPEPGGLKGMELNFLLPLAVTFNAPRVRPFLEP